jgi:hypothetical protein
MFCAYFAGALISEYHLWIYFYSSRLKTNVVDVYGFNEDLHCVIEMIFAFLFCADLDDAYEIDLLGFGFGCCFSSTLFKKSEMDDSCRPPCHDFGDSL